MKNGGLSRDKSHLNLPPAQLTITTPFFHKPRYKDKEFLQQKYVIERLSVGQISAEIGSSKDAVIRWLSRFDIPLREPHGHHGHPSQVKFGSKIRHGRSVDHYNELKVIETIKNLRAKGLSLRQIARTLSILGISTKQRGKKWHPESVSRILQR